MRGERRARIVALTVGWERVRKARSVHGDTSGEILVEPVPAIALDTDDGWTLIDTGLNTALIRDRPLRERLHGADSQAAAATRSPATPPTSRRTSSLRAPPTASCAARRRTRWTRCCA